MKREIKFRAYSNGEWVYSEPMPDMGFWKWVSYDSNTEFMQDTGLKDKNGLSIFEGDILRIKHKIGDNSDWYVDCYYKVNQMNHEGMSLSATKLFNDDPNNQHPINQTLSFERGNVCTDYVNQKYNHICIKDTQGENTMSNRTWKENHYSNDIEIAGNIYENPELLTTAPQPKK